MASASACIASGNDHHANDLMKAELGEIAREVALWEMSGEMKAQLYFGPMEQRLLDHFGLSVGRDLFRDFVDAFWLQSWTRVPLNRAKLERCVKPTTEWHRWVLTDHHLIRRKSAVGLLLSLLSNN
jgi:hypothetical protein